MILCGRFLRVSDLLGSLDSVSPFPFPQIPLPLSSPHKQENEGSLSTLIFYWLSISVHLFEFLFLFTLNVVGFKMSVQLIRQQLKHQKNVCINLNCKLYFDQFYVKMNALDKWLPAAVSGRINGRYYLPIRVCVCVLPIRYALSGCHFLKLPCKMAKFVVLKWSFVCTGRW